MSIDNNIRDMGNSINELIKLAEQLQSEWESYMEPDIQDLIKERDLLEEEIVDLNNQLADRHE